MHSCLLLAAIIVIAMILIAWTARPRGSPHCGAAGPRRIPGKIAMAAGGVAVVTIATATVVAGLVSKGGAHGRGIRVFGGGSEPRTHGGGVKLVPGTVYTPDELHEVDAVTSLYAAGSPPGTVDEIPGRLPWRNFSQNDVTTQHFGRRKLLLSEVDFLTRHGAKAQTVVYAGAAPGIHIPFLAELFPDHVFHLYDPAAFAESLGGLGRRVQTHRGLFTDETARHYRNTDAPVLFISDIRTVPGRTTTPRSKTAEITAFEAGVRVNLGDQKRWYGIIQPAAALLKFRFPFDAPEQMEYIDGVLRLQVWPGHFSAETRLEIPGPAAGTHVYSRRDYGERLFYHNIVTRDWAYFQHDVPTSGPGSAIGLDHCFDCAREVQIWEAYDEQASPGEIAGYINRAGQAVGKSLLRPPHGVCPATPMVHKRRWLSDVLHLNRPRGTHKTMVSIDDDDPLWADLGLPDPPAAEKKTLDGAAPDDAALDDAALDDAAERGPLGGKPPFTMEEFEMVRGSEDFSPKAGHITQEIEIFRTHFPEARTLIDATAHIGVDTAVLAESFPKAQITAIEIDAGTFGALSRNLKKRGLTERVTPVHADAVEYLKNTDDRVDMVYIDPPWGGKGYSRRKPMVDLPLGGVSLARVVDSVLERRSDGKRVAPAVVVKVPFTFHIQEFEKRVFMGRITEIIRVARLARGAPPAFLLLLFRAYE